MQIWLIYEINFHAKLNLQSKFLRKSRLLSQVNLQIPIRKIRAGFSKACGCDILNGYHISNTNDVLKVVFVRKNSYLCLRFNKILIFARKQLSRLSFGEILKLVLA